MIAKVYSALPFGVYVRRRRRRPADDKVSRVGVPLLRLPFLAPQFHFYHRNVSLEAGAMASGRAGGRSRAELRREAGGSRGN